MIFDRYKFTTRPHAFSVFCSWNGKSVQPLVPLIIWLRDKMQENLRHKTAAVEGLTSWISHSSRAFLPTFLPDSVAEGSKTGWISSFFYWPSPLQEINKWCSRPFDWTLLLSSLFLVGSLQNAPPFVTFWIMRHQREPNRHCRAITHSLCLYFFQYQEW